MTATPNKKKSGFYIELTCPGCGCDLVLEDDFSTVHCNHCDTIHRILPPDTVPAYLVEAKVDERQARFSIDRYLKKKNLPLSDSNMQLKKVYYPFWKIDAILLRRRKKNITRIVADELNYDSEYSYEQTKTEISLSPYSTTLAAGVRFDGLPESIGQRGDYIKMTVLADGKADSDFDILSVKTPWEDVRHNLNDRLQVIKNIDINQFGNNRTELFSPEAILVYFPFLVFDDYEPDGFNRYVVDAVTGRMINHLNELPEVDRNAPIAQTAVEFGNLKIEPHICPTCGFDLPDQLSLIYICQNCETIVNLDRLAASIDQVYSGAAGDDHQIDRMVPFWVLKLSPEIKEKVRVYFAGIYDSDYLVVPAFDMSNFDAMFRLTKRISAAFPKYELNPVNRFDPVYAPVNISASKAMTLGNIFIRREEMSRNSNQFQDISPADIEEIKLVYIPFEAENYFYIDSFLQAVSLEKTQIP